MEKEEKAVAEAKPTRNYRGWKAMPFIIGNETFEKLGTIGTSSNLIVYLTTVFNMKRVSAATLVNIFNGTTNLTPLVGAFLSDTYFGRYKTLGVTTISSFVGLTVVMFTAAIAKLHPPDCGNNEKCVEPNGLQLGCLLIAFGFLVFGAGGIRSCNLPFGADQFDPETEAGKRGINSFFNWYFFTFTFAMMVSLTVIVYVQDEVSWALGLGIPAFLMFLACVVYFLGSKIYVKVTPEGSPFTSLVQVFVAASKKRGLKLPSDPQYSLFNPIDHKSLNSKLPHTDQFRWLDKAAIATEEDEINSDGLAVNPWKLCRMQQVEELKCLIRVMPIWASGIIYTVAGVQQSTYVVIQALQSNRQLGHLEIPAASFTVFSMLTLTIWIPIYDRVVVPSIRRLTGKEGGFTLLQRMGIGIVLSILTMIISGIVEQQRRSVALHHPIRGTNSDRGGAISSLSAIWLIPQLSISGLSEAFNAVAQFEFYYKQFPENMRSFANSLFFLGIAGSNYLSSLIVTIVHQTTKGDRNWLPEDLNKGRLEYFYYLIAGLGIVNFGYFLVCARWYRYKGVGSEASEAMEVALEANKLKIEVV
eukprot:TRINITY_DN1782_c0_g1_i2.p1 TRINITY_DN1782_c0_g1~~TRINITY_DN1782_c0_g1_i2.p1  ORF type:complete len:585 (-),score=62.21 TRINITY_DN1782_c0_g1_i2:380-2134(-)